MKKLRILKSSAQALKMIWMLNELIIANQMVLMRSWTIEWYGVGIGDDFDAKMNKLEYMIYKMVLMNSWNIEQYGASIGDEFDAKMN